MRNALLLAAVVLTWGLAFVAIKALLDDGVDGATIALGRYAVAAPAFIAVLVLRPLRPARSELPRLVICGILVVAVYHLSLNFGARDTTAGTAALIVATAPAQALVLSRLAGLDTITPRRLAGLAVALGGVAVVITLGAGGEIGADSLRGPALVALAPLSFAAYNVLLKPLLAHHDPLSATAWTSLVGSVPLLLALPVAWDDAGTADAADWALIAFLGVVCTAVGYIVWNVVLRVVSPAQAVSALYGVPVVAVAGGALLLDEPITTWFVVGGALVVAGVALASWPGRVRARPGP